MPLVSVLLPVYNAEDFVHEAIGSILCQSMDDFELIVICNGSNLDTLERINSFSDKRIKVLHLDAPDIVDALNTGISEAKGIYIARMDADDYAAPDRLIKQVRFLESAKDHDVVSCLVYYKGNAAKNQGYYLHVEWINSLISYESIYQNRFADSPVAHPSLMCRKKIFDKYGPYRKGDFPEDYELILRWLEEGVKIGKVNEYLLSWRDHGSRLSRNHEAYREAAFYKVKTKYFAEWFRRKFSGENEVLIWGKGRVVKRKAQYLAEHGIQIAGFIDVKRDEKFHKPPVYHFTEIPGQKFILSYVGDRKGKLQIKKFLMENGLDFHMMS